MFNTKTKLFLLVFLVLLIGVTVWLWQTQQGVHADLIIKNARIATMESDTIIDTGWVAINNTNIVAVEKGHCCGNYKSQTTIDAHDQLLLPGFINTHSHVGMTSLRNADNSHKLKQWLQNTGELEKRFSEDDVYNASLVGLTEMLRNGITTVNDMYFMPEQTIKAAQELDARVMVRVPTVRDENNQLHIDRTFYDKYKSTPRVYLNLAPNPLTEYSLDELRWFAKTANELQMPVHIHLAEDPNADKEILQKFDLSPLELLRQSGLIDTKLIIAHAVTFSAADIAEIAMHKNISISFNPKSNFLLSDFTAPIDQYIANDITAGIGTDSAASVGTLDVLDQIRFAAFVSRCSARLNFCIDQRQISPYTWIKMATLDGAQTLGLEDKLGSITVGKQADIVLVGANNFTDLVYSKSAANISTVVVAGKIIGQ